MQKWRIGIDSGNSLVTEEIVGLLQERGFPYKSITLYGAADDFGEAVDIGDQSYPLTNRDEGVENPPDILFITSEADNNAAPIKARLTISAKENPSMQKVLVIPEINVAAIHEGIHEGVVNVPSPAAIAVATALYPLDEELGLKKLHVTTIEPMSCWGRAGLEMFGNQVNQLLNSIEPEGHEQLAFNFLPFVGPFLPKNALGSQAVSELLLNKELGHFFNRANITSIRCNAPIFYGLGAMIDAEFDEDVDLAKVAEILRSAPGIMLLNEDEREPVGLREVVGSDCTTLGRLQADPANKKRLLLWAALDNLRQGAATTMVEIAEIASRDYGPHLAGN